MVIEIILFILLIAAVCYRWLTKSFDKWAKLGIPHDKPTFPYGTHNILTLKSHLSDLALDDYKKYKLEKGQDVHGWFLFGKPALSINNVEMIKQIQVKDFNHFVDRSESNATKIFSNSTDLDELWGLQLTNASGDHWKDLRSTFTPIFTSGKMKTMLKFIQETNKNLDLELLEKAKRGEEFDLKATFGKFSLDSLASCAFGMDAQSFTDKNSVFVKYSARIFQNTLLDNLTAFSRFIPGVNNFLRLLKVNTFKPKETKYLSDCIMKALKARRESGVRRNDLIDLMLDAIKEGDKVNENVNAHVGGDQYEEDMKFAHKKQGNISEKEVVATAMVFLVAGYDTTGMTLSYLAYAMSKNPDIQERLQEEIDQAFEDNNGEMPDYNAILRMPLLDAVIHETLRLYNPVGLNTRTCTSDYRLPGTDISLKTGDFITFSVAGIHTDPEHYSHPEDFWPDHFMKEEKAARHPYAFQGFGQGPRACIGMRFALLEAKVAILSTWRRFSFVPGTKTQEPLRLDPQAQLGWCIGGVWAKAVERNL